MAKNIKQDLDISGVVEYLKSDNFKKLYKNKKREYVYAFLSQHILSVATSPEDGKLRFVADDMQISKLNNFVSECIDNNIDEIALKELKTLLLEFGEPKIVQYLKSKEFLELETQKKQEYIYTFLSQYILYTTFNPEDKNSKFVANKEQVKDLSDFISRHENDIDDATLSIFKEVLGEFNNLENIEEEIEQPNLPTQLPKWKSNEDVAEKLENGEFPDELKNLLNVLDENDERVQKVMPIIENIVTDLSKASGFNYYPQILISSSYKSDFSYAISEKNGPKFLVLQWALIQKLNDTKQIAAVIALTMAYEKIASEQETQVDELTPNQEMEAINLANNWLKNSVYGPDALTEVLKNKNINGKLVINLSSNIKKDELDKKLFKHTSSLESHTSAFDKMSTRFLENIEVIKNRIGYEETQYNSTQTILEPVKLIGEIQYGRKSINIKRLFKNGQLINNWQKEIEGCEFINVSRFVLKFVKDGDFGRDTEIPEEFYLEIDAKINEKTLKDLYFLDTSNEAVDEINEFLTEQNYTKLSLEAKLDILINLVRENIPPLSLLEARRLNTIFSFISKLELDLSDDAQFEKFDELFNLINKKDHNDKKWDKYDEKTYQYLVGITNKVTSSIYEDIKKLRKKLDNILEEQKTDEAKNRLPTVIDQYKEAIESFKKSKTKLEAEGNAALVLELHKIISDDCGLKNKVMKEYGFSVPTSEYLKKPENLPYEPDYIQILDFYDENQEFTSDNPIRKVFVLMKLHKDPVVAKKLDVNSDLNDRSQYYEFNRNENGAFTSQIEKGEVKNQEIDSTLLRQDFEKFIITHKNSLSSYEGENRIFVENFFKEITKIFKEGDEKLKEKVRNFMNFSYYGVNNLTYANLYSSKLEYDNNAREQRMYFSEDHPAIEFFKQGNVGFEVLTDEQKFWFLLHTKGMFNIEKNGRGFSIDKKQQLSLREYLLFPETEIESVSDLVEIIKTERYHNVVINVLIEDLIDKLTEQKTPLAFDDLLNLQYLISNHIFQGSLGAEFKNIDSKDLVPLRKNLVTSTLSQKKITKDTIENWKKMKAIGWLDDFPKEQQEFRTRIEKEIFSNEANYSKQERIEIIELLVTHDVYDFTFPTEIKVSSSDLWRLKDQNMYLLIKSKGKYSYKRDDVFGLEVQNKSIEELLEFYSTKLGQDNGSEDYKKNVEQELKHLKEKFSPLVFLKFTEKLAEKVIAQEDTAYLMRNLSRDYSSYFSQENYNFIKDLGFGNNQEFQNVARYGNDQKKRELYLFRKNTIRTFLINPLTDDSIHSIIGSEANPEQFTFAKMKKNGLFDEVSFDQIRYGLESFHKNFWNLSLEERVLILDFILFPLGDEEKTKKDAVDDIIKKVLDTFGENDELIKNLIQEYANQLPINERKLFSLALLITTSNAANKGKVSSLGEQMMQAAKFLGPLGGKMLQVIHSTTTDQKLKKDLEKSKTEYAPMTRWDAIEQIRKIVPKGTRIGKCLGTGSIGATYEIGDGQVITIVKPGAENQIKREYKFLSAVAKSMNDQKYIDAVERAYNSAIEECNLGLSQRQYQSAQNAYEPLKLKVRHKRVNYEVSHKIAEHSSSGEESGVSYKIFNKAQGKSFGELSEDEKKIVAKSMLASNLSLEHIFLLISEPDRHRGNFNVVIEGNKITINHFDLGMMPINPEKARVTPEQQDAIGKIFARAYNKIKKANSRTQKSGEKAKAGEILINEIANFRNGECSDEVKEYLSLYSKNIATLGEYIDILDPKEFVGLFAKVLLESEKIEENVTLQSFKKEIDIIRPNNGFFKKISRPASTIETRNLKLAAKHLSPVGDIKRNDGR